jgi:pentapeptide MXKDX repeat protein
MTKLVLAAACCLSLLSLARADDAMQAPGDRQADQMHSPDGMQKDGMQKDGMQKDDGMHQDRTSKSAKEKPHMDGKDESNWRQLGEGMGGGM